MRQPAAICKPNEPRLQGATASFESTESDGSGGVWLALASVVKGLRVWGQTRLRVEVRVWGQTRLRVEFESGDRFGWVCK